MVKKLLKYEFLSYWKLALLIGGALFGLGALLRCVQFLEADTFVFEIFSNFSVLIYVLSIFAAITLTEVLVVVRFYRSMFSTEGYLTFTLPATNAQILISKLLSALLFSAFTVVSIILSVAVATAGDLGIEILNAAAYLLNRVYQEIGHHLIWVCLEGVCVILLSATANCLLFFTCMSIGQLANKARVPLAIGVYFGYSFIGQVATSILSTILSAVVLSDEYATILQYIEQHPALCFHGFMLAMILWTALCAAVYYFITYSILRKKLNLE